MSVPADRYYTKTHEWALLLSGKRIRVGITKHAVEELGDITYVEIRPIGTRVRAGEPIGTIESNKATEKIYAPISGIIVERNREAGVVEEGAEEFGAGELERIADDPYGSGWIADIEADNPEELNNLLKAEEYEKLLKG
jgi:glycine cleavage system H protein